MTGEWPRWCRRRGFHHERRWRRALKAGAALVVRLTPPATGLPPDELGRLLDAYGARGARGRFSGVWDEPEPPA